MASVAWMLGAAVGVAGVGYYLATRHEPHRGSHPGESYAMKMSRYYTEKADRADAATRHRAAWREADTDERDWRRRAKSGALGSEASAAARRRDAIDKARKRGASWSQARAVADRKAKQTQSRRSR